MFRKTAKDFSIFGFALTIAHSASAVIAIYVSPPGDVISSVPNIDKIEDFSNAPATWTGTTAYIGATGTYTQIAGDIVTGNNDVYGIDDSEFLSLGENAVLELNIGQDAQYLSFAWPAGDSQNRFTVFDGTVELFSLDLEAVVNFLPNTEGTQVQAINGSNYNTQDYWGQPVTGNIPTEPYAVIHILASAGSTFDRVVFSQGDDGGRFEIDNHALIYTSSPAVVPPGEFVERFENVPEPSAYAFILGSVALVLATSRRRRS